MKKKRSAKGPNPAESEKKLRVLVTASQRIHYMQVKMMTQKEWDEFKAKPPKYFTSPDDLWLDPMDVYDADDIEGEDFEAIVVGEDNKPIKPRDEYTGKAADG
jgi:hypothetical protein